MATDVNGSGNVTDYLLGLDDLQQPRVIDMSIIQPNEWNSAILMIARLILMVPGVQENHPEMGVDIRGRYRFSFEEELTAFANDTQTQIMLYLPEFTPVSVSTYYGVKDLEGYILIDIEIDQVTYRLLYSIADQTIRGLEGI